MEWAEYTADGQEPETCHFFNLGLRRAAFYRASSLRNRDIWGWHHRRLRWETEFVFFLGGRTSFVVRATEDNCYSLLGKCYVHGMMDGEAIDALEEGRYALETILIF
jgi:hypothetical protein